ncbi:hypothetical protein Hdeb2414_s0423g00890181 [Helianthus debilis subsp. tardiflorus]
MSKLASSSTPAKPEAILDCISINFCPVATMYLCNWNVSSRKCSNFLVSSFDFAAIHPLLLASRSFSYCRKYH